MSGTLEVMRSKLYVVCQLLNCGVPEKLYVLSSKF